MNEPQKFDLFNSKLRRTPLGKNLGKEEAYFKSEFLDKRENENIFVQEKNNQESIVASMPDFDPQEEQTQWFNSSYQDLIKVHLVKENISFFQYVLEVFHLFYVKLISK